jgi:hypothetical protein
MGKFEGADYRIEARERWQFARKPHRLEVGGVSHLAYYWGRPRLRVYFAFLL